MKKANTVINFKNDEVTMYGEKIKVRFTSTGHYCITLNKYVDVCYYGSETFNIYFSNLEKVDTFTFEEKERAAIKLHKQFCHATGPRLRKLLVNARVRDKEMLKLVENVANSCDICKKYRKTPPKPIVTMPLAKVFNENVSMDLKDISSDNIKSEKVIHLIDHATRFSAARIIPSKKRDVVIQAVLEMWHVTFGPMKQILTDNGGEFTNDHFAEMSEKLNTKIISTAAESPWSNGINERHNGLLGQMVLKTMEDTKCDMKTALMWSVTAKNNLANVNGFTPSQLVFGQNASFPSVLHNKLPALDNQYSTEYMRTNLNIMHTARENFIKAESCEKLKRALRMKTRTHTSKIFEIGQSVYFKREDSSRWKGPGDVIGIQGETIVIKYSGNIVRVHSSRVQIEHSEFIPNELNEEDTQGEFKGIQKKDVMLVPSNSIDTTSINNTVQHNNTVQQNSTTSIIENDRTSNTTELENRNNEIENNNIDEVNREHNPTPIVKDTGGQEGTTLLPKIKSRVLVKPGGSNEFRQVKIVSKGKPGGRNKSWVNVLDEESQTLSGIDWSQVDEWEELPAEEVLVSDGFNPDELWEAKLKEMNKWKDYEAYIEVDDTGQKAISTRWVNTIKDGEIKSRLCARGYEDTELTDRVDSPTCEKSNLRLAMAIAAANQWQINSLDVQSAFLQGENVVGDIHIRPPKEANTNKLWKLVKHVYGLKQASRKWYEKVLSELLKLGVCKSKLDEAFFYRHEDGVLSGVIAGHVDDFFWAGNEEFRKKIIDPIRKTFKISSDLQDSFRFLGLNVKQYPSHIVMNQETYAKSMKPLEINNKQNKNRILSDEEKDKLRSAIGQLSWLGNQSRPDISANVCQLSGTYKNATVADILFANKTIKKVSCEDLSLYFPKLNLSKLTLEVHSDASYKNLPNAGSQGGFIILLCDDLGNAAPIQWQARRIKRVVKSTLAAECLALEDAIDYAYYIKCILDEVLGLSKGSSKINCYIDNKSLHDVLHSSNNVKEDKRLIQDVSLIKETMHKEEVNSVSLVESKWNLADPLTKRGASCQLLENVLRAGSISCLMADGDS